MKILIPIALLILINCAAIAQSTGKGKYGDGPDDVPAAGIIKNLTDDQLLETVQKRLGIGKK
jgi:hypothetical protein